MNIVEEIKRQRHGDGGRIAICDGDLEISYDSLFQEVGKIAQHLAGLPAFSKSEVPRIGVRFPNGLGYIVIALAVVESGACFVPIPDELTAEEREKLIRETALHAVVASDEGGEEDGVLSLPFDLGYGKVSECPLYPCLFPEAEFETLKPAFIRFSSGTTAASKGVILSHRSLLERITAANQALQISAGDRILWTLPMAHHFAVSIILYLYTGATTVLEASHLPENVYEAARRNQVQFLYGSPFHFAQLAQCVEARPLPALKLAVSTASGLSDGVADAFYEKFHFPLTQALGIIEVGLPIVNTRHAVERPTALGEVLDGYDWKIDLPDRGASGEDESGGVGELLLRGPGMFDAYLIPWRTREQVMEKGWFRTGDLVEIVEGTAQTLILRGRCKSVINVGGMKVFPEEIEAVINEHPRIERCRVFACRHPSLGAYPGCEFIAVASDDIEGGGAALSLKDLRAFCQKRLAPYKIPMVMKEVGKIELTASGKVKRHGR